MPTTVEAIAEVEPSELFMAIDAGPWKNVFASAPVMRITEGTIRGYTGPGHGLYYIEEGRLRFFAVSPRGSEKTYCILAENAMFGEINLVDQTPTPWLCVAMCDSVLRRLDVPVARQAMAQNPDLALAVITSLARRVKWAAKQVGDLSFRTVASRVACVILARASAPEAGDTSKPVRVPLTHEYLASFIGSNRVTVTRVLRGFQEMGVIEYDRTLQNIIIHDRGHLEAIAAETV